MKQRLTLIDVCCRLLPLIPIALFAIACGPAETESPSAESDTMMVAAQPLTAVGEGVRVTETAFASAEAECTDTFVTHELDHITTNAYEPVDMYDSNGSGVAVNDIDGDGLIDIVLANLAGDNHIFWNQGNLTFEKQSLGMGSTRALATVDVNTDGLLDIVLTTRVGTPLVFANMGNRQFERSQMRGVNEYAYSMNWGDLDGDGDLDLVTGSYDTSLEKELRDTFMFGNGAGVFYFENQGTEFVGQRLADTAQALAIELFDVNNDGRDDILVGNDFYSVRDYYWYATDAGWERAEPFETTTENTMSYDSADVNNDGSLELYAVDMHPVDDSPETQAAWNPVMELMMATHTMVEGDPQVMANVLQMQDESGTFTDSAMSTGVAYTGWSWSTKFGDLDQDGYVDLYSVNGMASFETFNHMPDYTLVEENRALRNDGAGNFNFAPEWGLNLTAGGRGMSMADFDNDGDLDIVVNNLLDKAYLLENQLCSGDSLTLELTNTNSANTYAIGAVVELDTSIGTLQRDVRVASGYLSGDSTRVHFGFPADATLYSAIITWPDGERTSLYNLQPNQHIEVQR